MQSTTLILVLAFMASRSIAGLVEGQPFVSERVIYLNVFCENAFSVFDNGDLGPCHPGDNDSSKDKQVREGG